MRFHVPSKREELASPHCLDWGTSFRPLYSISALTVSSNDVLIDDVAATLMLINDHLNAGCTLSFIEWAPLLGTFFT